MSPKKITVDGKLFDNLADAARHYDILPTTLRARLRSGWQIEEVFNIKMRKKTYNHGKKINFFKSNYNFKKLYYFHI